MRNDLFRLPGASRLLLIGATLALLSLLSHLTACQASAAVQPAAAPMQRPALAKRAADPKQASHVMHNHLARKVFDRACAASKDTIDEIIECLHGNEQLKKSINPTIAADCYKEAFGLEFDPKEVHKHKELICNNREKFEGMTACVYRKTAESLDASEMEKLTEAMVDVGLCIINALDG